MIARGRTIGSVCSGRKLLTERAASKRFRKEGHRRSGDCSMKLLLYGSMITGGKLREGNGGWDYTGRVSE